ncbi:SDR family oxidoreductase [Streptomyces sp. NRRL S-337]|uniref:SDR family oxidoreductase n=1 Tax=Streptomyces sp. NRRL S-337 TaxID=1463900 RepID=UPI0004C93D42|nr:SDR family oxidoreductase [Streptomyces sp. NRRL S-337]
MKTILVLGGTGKTGSRIARRLKAAGLPVRTASRTGGDFRLDLDDPASWTPALDGVTAAYLVEPSLSRSTDHQARIPQLVSEGVTAGVRRLVLLSAPRAGEDGHPLHAAEQAVRASGIDWTILRPQWFAQNFSEGPWRHGILAGTLALPTGDGRTPFVDAEDIAEVAVAALTEDGHSGRIYELTGPRAISFGEAADLIARATARTVRHLDVDPADFVERQVAAGASPDVAQLLTGLLGAIRNGAGAALSDGVERALGRPPRTFEAFVNKAAAAGHWN